MQNNPTSKKMKATKRKFRATAIIEFKDADGIKKTLAFTTQRADKHRGRLLSLIYRRCAELKGKVKHITLP